MRRDDLLLQKRNKPLPTQKLLLNRTKVLSQREKGEEEGERGRGGGDGKGEGEREEKEQHKSLIRQLLRMSPNNERHQTTYLKSLSTSSSINMITCTHTHICVTHHIQTAENEIEGKLWRLTVKMTQYIHREELHRLLVRKMQAERTVEWHYFLSTERIVNLEL